MWWCVLVCVLSHVQVFVTPWTIVHQDPLSMGFAKQETGVGSHFLVQGIFQIQGLNPHLHVFWISGIFFTAESPGKHIQPLLAIRADVLGDHLPGTDSPGGGVLLGAQTPHSLWRTFAVVTILFRSLTWGCASWLYSFHHIPQGLPSWLSGKESAWKCRRCKRHEFDP